jgi:hypothetical protein
MVTCRDGVGRTTSVGLNTYSGFLTDTTVFGRRVELIDVMPYPISSEFPIAKEDYSVKLVVE